MRLSAKELSQPVSEDQPCGDDLEYDAAFQKVETLLQSKSEQEFGETVIPGSGPDWKGVGTQAVDLLKRTRDLRLLSYATIAQLHTDGLLAFRDGLEALGDCLEKFWEPIYPLLDVEDNNDATMRFNTLQTLNDHKWVCEGIERSTLVVLKGIGGFSLRDIELAEGKIDAVDDEEVQDIAVIKGSFGDASKDDMTALGAAIGGSIEQLERITTLWGSLATDAAALDMDNTLKSLKDVLRAIKTYAPVAAAAVGAEEGADLADAATRASEPVSGVINSRDDVVRAIDKICEYYSVNEPSSPVPLLLRRAQRLVAKSFYEILEDMVPDSMAQAKVISGKTDKPA
jgi:type VI secretion system protein ImpA